MWVKQMESQIRSIGYLECVWGGGGQETLGGSAQELKVFPAKTQAGFSALERRQFHAACTKPPRASHNPPRQHTCLTLLLCLSTLFLDFGSFSFLGAGWKSGLLKDVSFSLCTGWDARTEVKSLGAKLHFSTLPKGVQEAAEGYNFPYWLPH